MVGSWLRFSLPLAVAMLMVAPLWAQQSIFTAQTPQVPVDTDNAAGEFGMIFTSSAAGQITGLRYWKSSSDTGTHTGRLWRVSDRALLATVTFSGGSSSGWQTQNLSAPVTIAAGTQYLVTVSTPKYYGYTNKGLGNVITNGYLSTVVGSNGLYGFTLGAYPTLIYQQSNYFRDVVFVPSGGATPTIDVTPNTVTLNFNQQQQFSAALAGGATGPVTWSATCGTVNGSGLYTAPASGASCTVTGQVTGASDASSVTLTSAPAPTIDVTPNTVTLNFNQQQQFSAALGGGATGPVTWSATCGSINGSGLFTAPSTGSSCTVTGTVTGASDQSTVTLNQAPPPSASTFYFKDFREPEWYVMNRTSDTSNNETACYRPEQVNTTNGLVITAINQANTCSSGISASQQWPYTSGMIQWNSRAWRYGTLEFRAKFPRDGGVWPSLWMLGDACQTWYKTLIPPDCPGAGEIDALEIFSGSSGVNQQIHVDTHHDQCSPTLDVTQYHVYQLIWQPGSLVWKIDGITTCTVTASYVPSNPMFLIINLALGGVGGGTVDANKLPQSLTIDYVKIIQ